MTDREWPAADKQAAAARLRERGIFDGNDKITPIGMDLHLSLEEATDRISALAGHGGAEDVDRIVSLLEFPLARVRGAPPTSTTSPHRSHRANRRHPDP